jgi:hypothetical protein
LGKDSPSLFGEFQIENVSNLQYLILKKIFLYIFARKFRKILKFRTLFLRNKREIRNNHEIISQHLYKNAKLHGHLRRRQWQWFREGAGSETPSECGQLCESVQQQQQYEQQ